MSIPLIERAGRGARILIDAVRVMHEIRNTRMPLYQDLLAKIRNYFKDETLTFKSLTDNQINEYFFKNLGNTEAITAAKKILDFWETLIISLDDACNQIGIIELLETSGESM